MSTKDIRSYSDITFTDTDDVDWIVYYEPYTDEYSCGRPFTAGEIVGIEQDAEQERWLDLNGKDAAWLKKHEDAILTQIDKHLSDRSYDYD